MSVDGGVVAIETVGLGKDFADKVALEGLDLRVRAGEVMAFLGPNGSGKTTTIRLLMGLLKPSRGTARICGKDCHAESAEVKRVVGYLPDEPFVYPYLSGLETLEMVAGLHGMSGPVARARAGALGERFVGQDVQRLAVTYSHGTRKRLALAAALLHAPDVLILDEPTNGLDPAAARQMRQTLVQLAAEGKTIFLSTHLLASADELCHRVAIVKEGRLLACGTPDELRHQHGAGTGNSLEDVFLKLTA